jgi:hypothetical protein
MLKIIFISTLTLFACMSCSSGQQDLEVSFTGKDNIYLIPADTESCYSKFNPDNLGNSNDVSKKYFQIKNPTFVWKSTKANFYIVAIKVTLNAMQFPGGVYTAILAGNELASLNNSYGEWNGELPAATSEDTPTIVPSQDHPDRLNSLVFCPMTFGGISIPDTQDTDFSASGSVQIIGIQRTISNGAETGEEVPLTITSSITVNNIGLSTP